MGVAGPMVLGLVGFRAYRVYRVHRASRVYIQGL